MIILEQPVSLWMKLYLVWWWVWPYLLVTPLVLASYIGTKRLLERWTHD